MSSAAESVVCAGGGSPSLGGLRVGDVERLHQVLGGDPVTEALVLRFIGDRWGAETLFDLPPKVAGEALRRPADFLRAAKQHGELEVAF